MRTVELASAVPTRMGVVLVVDGEDGIDAEMTGAAGATSSCVYVYPLAEHPLTFPAGSVAVPKNVVDVLAPTVTLAENVPPALTTPVPWTVPEQSLAA
jgi:hypothetical protein